MTNDRSVKETKNEASALGDAPASAARISAADGGPEVVARGRRFFSKADKQRILQAADRCSAPGEIGALMRREGVYSSSLSTWRRQRPAAEQAALAPRKRGPKPPADRDQVLQVAHLTRDNDRLENRLDNALFVIEVQKSRSQLAELRHYPRQHSFLYVLPLS